MFRTLLSCCLLFRLPVSLQVEGGRPGHDRYKYAGGYWEARESGAWEGVRDIYGPGPMGRSGAEEPAKLLL